jgi:hypothetical protein
MYCCSHRPRARITLGVRFLLAVDQSVSGHVSGHVSGW